MNPIAAPNSALVTPESPWLGLRPFTEDVRGYFFGRDRELADLFERVALKPLTVLFGQSGLGKTSLLQAALIPRLRHAGFVPVVVRLDHADGVPPLEAQVLEALRVVLDPEAVALPADDAPAPLWRLLHDPACGLCQPGAPRVVLMLDQFEELFTLGETTPARRAASEAFLDALAEVVENRVPPALRSLLEDDDALADRLDYAARPLKLLLSLREDFLHRLERWRPQMPSLMDNRFELRLLTGPQALEAVLEPGRLRCQLSPSPSSSSSSSPSLPPIVSPETGVEIVRFVAGVKSDVPLAEIDAVPPLLSLLCAELNAQRGESLVIRAEQLGGRAEDILAQFYERCFSPHPAAVRRFVEERLLSPEGFRQNANEDTFLHELAQAGMSGVDARRVLIRLVDDRLLVSEERGSIRRIELTHDTLTGVARRSRDLRHQSEAAARRRRERTRWLAVSAGLLLLVTGVSVPLAVWALREKTRAQHQEKAALESKEATDRANASLEKEKQRAEAGEKAADEAKGRAVAAKKSADELINYMQHDLSDTLGKLGQLKMMEGINARIRKYHADHPAEEGDLAALREQSVALNQRGDVLLAQGQLAAALKAYRDSLAIAERLAKQNANNAGWQRDLSVSYIKIGDVLRDQGQLGEALQAYRDSLAIRDRLAKEDSDNARCQYDLGISHERIGGVLQMQWKLVEALSEYRAKQRIVERLTKQDPENTSWQRDLSVSHNGVGDVLLAQGLLAEALKAYRDGLAIAWHLAKQDPDNADWQRRLSVSYGRVGNVLHAQGQLAEALKVYRDSLAIGERLAKRDPDNAGWQRDLSYSFYIIGHVLERQGALGEALTQYQASLSIDEKLSKLDPTNATWQEDVKKSRAVVLRVQEAMKAAGTEKSGPTQPKK